MSTLVATLTFIFDDKGNILLGMKKRGFGKNKINGFGGFVFSFSFESRMYYVLYRSFYYYLLLLFV